METDWLPVPDNVTVLIPRVLRRVTVSREGPHMVRGYDERGRLALVPLEFLDEESRERVRKALEAER
jgi:hypothetical protein